MGRNGPSLAGGCLGRICLQLKSLGANSWRLSADCSPSRRMAGSSSNTGPSGNLLAGQRRPCKIKSSSGGAGQCGGGAAGLKGLGLYHLLQVETSRTWWDVTGQETHASFLALELAMGSSFVVFVILWIESL